MKKLKKNAVNIHFFAILIFGGEEREKLFSFLDKKLDFAR